MTIFDNYSHYYDLLYRDKDYASEAEYVASMIRQHAPDARRILELGCGTGIHAEFLARLGFTVVGVDFSETMLNRAEARKRGLSVEIGSRLAFVQGNARNFYANENFDVVISLFHVLSYQTTHADLQAVFNTAALHLMPGGLFLYDFWYGPAVLSQKPDVRVKHLEDDDIRVTRIAEPTLLANENKVNVDYSIFIEHKKTGQFQKICETHSMRYLFLPELSQLYGSHFQALMHGAWMDNRPLNESSWSGVSLLIRTDH